MPAEGGAATSVTHNASGALQPSWSPDGASIVFIARTPDSVFARVIHRANGAWTSGSNVATLRRAGSHPRFSPDGRQLLAIDTRTVITTSASGGAVRALFAPPGWAAFLATWAGDGQSVYVLASDSGALLHLMSVPLAGAPRRLIRFDDPVRQPTRYGLVARGGRIYFTYGEREADIAVMPIGRRR